MISLRVVLIFRPYQFHAANQQRLFCTLFIIILGIPLVDCLIKVYLVGHPCDYAVEAVSQSLFQKSLALEMGPYQFPLFIIQLLTFSLFVITFLYEWRKSVKGQRSVGPMTLAPLPAAHKGSQEAFPVVGKTTPTSLSAGFSDQHLRKTTISHGMVSKPQVIRQAWGDITMNPNRLNANSPTGHITLSPLLTSPTGFSSPQASIVARIGGLTLLALVFDLMILVFVIKVLREDSTAIVLALKAHCMSGQLVWYWISSSPEIREATDAKLARTFRKFLPETFINIVAVPTAPPSPTAHLSNDQMLNEKTQSNLKNSSIHIILH